MQARGSTQYPLRSRSWHWINNKVWDSLRLRYNLQGADLPSHCACGDLFTVSHAPSCKTRSSVAQRHDDIRNLLTSLLSKVCKDVEIEPHLLPIDNKVFNLRSTVTSPEARLDIKAGSFWSRGETASFHVRVTHVNSTCNQNKSTELIFVEHEQEKKGKHQHRVIDVEMGSFNSLPFNSLPLKKDIFWNFKISPYMCTRVQNPF